MPTEETPKESNEEILKNMQTMLNPEEGQKINFPLGEMCEKLSTEVWTKLTDAFSRDRDLDDADLIRKWLRNVRRGTLRGLIDAKIDHGVALRDMIAVSERNKDNENLIKMKARTVDEALRIVEAWTMRLKEVTKFAHSEEYVAIINEIYGETKLATDNEA